MSNFLYTQLIEAATCKPRLNRLAGLRDGLVAMNGLEMVGDLKILEAKVEVNIAEYQMTYQHLRHSRITCLPKWFRRRLS